MSKSTSGLKPTKTPYLGKVTVVEPNADGLYPCPDEECDAVLSKGALKTHIDRFHTETPDDDAQPESSRRGRTQTLREASHPYSSTGRRRSGQYTSSPLARSTSPLNPESSDGPVAAMDLRGTRRRATSPAEVAAQLNPPGRTINTESVSITVQQSEILAGFELVVLQPFGLLTCVSCGWGFGSDHASGHVSTTHQNHGLTQKVVDKLVQKHRLRTHAELVACKPKGVVPIFPVLRSLPGLACSGCDFVTSSVDMMAKHLLKHPKGSAISESATLQLFLPAKHSGYIHVQPVPSTEPKSASDLVNEAMALDRETYEPALIDNTDWRSIHPFLEISGWSVWMNLMTRKDVDAMRVHLKALDELINDCRVLVRTMWKCCTAENYSARCHINSATEKIETSPFGSLKTSESRERYALTWARFIAMIVNTINHDVAVRRYTLSSTQEAAVTKYTEATVEARRVSALLQLSQSLVACNFEGLEGTTHPIVCFAILSNTKPGGLVADPEEITPFLAALQYFCRAIMFLWAYGQAAASMSEDAMLSVPTQLQMIIPTQAEPGTQGSQGTQGTQQRRYPRVTLFQASLACSKWLKEGDITPFSYVRQMMHLAAMLSSSTNRMGRFVWDFSGAERFSFDGDVIDYADFRGMMAKSLDDLSAKFLSLWASFDLPEEWLIDDLTTIGEALSSRAEHYNFMRHGGNVHLTDRAREIRDRIANGGKYFRNVDGTLFALKSNMKKTLAMCEDFVKDLAAMVYLHGGQPPRGTELMSTLIMNLPTRIRNFIIVNGKVFIVGFLNKTTFIVNADKAIPRMFPNLLGKILVNYISFIRGVEHLFLTHTLENRDDAQSTLSRLFHVNGRQLGTPDLTASLKRVTTKYLKVKDGYGTADLRQILIYISTRFIKDRAPDKGDETQALLDIQAGHRSEVARKCYGVEMERLGGTVDTFTLQTFHGVSRLHHVEWGVEDADWRPPIIAPVSEEIVQVSDIRNLHDLAVHGDPFLTWTQGTSNVMDVDVEPRSSIPGRLSSRMPDLPSSPGPMSDLAPFQAQLPLSLTPDLTDRMQRLRPDLRSASPSPSINPGQLTPRRPASPMSEDGHSAFSSPHAPPMSPLPSVVQVFSASSTPSTIPTSATASTFKALQELRPGGRFKSLEQAQATQLVALRNNHVLAVMPTNAGKTAIVSVNAKLNSKVAIGETPMITIMLAPTTALLNDLKARFEKEHIPAVMWTGPGTHAIGILLATYESAVSTSFMDYTRELAKLGRLGQIVIDECHYPRSNLPFRLTMQKLNQLVNVGVPMLLLTGSLPPTAVNDTLKFFGIDQALIIRMQTARPNIRYSTQSEPLPYGHDESEHANDVLTKLFQVHQPRGRIIIYCQSKKLVDYLCGLHEEWWPYHADTDELAKAKCLDEWDANGKNIVVATSSFSMGIDRPDVHWVIHLGAPRNMDDYIQESGRGGRGGDDAEARIITWRPVQEPRFDSAGSGLLPAFVSSQSICRRVILEGYADGYAFNCISQPNGTRLCDNCERQNTAELTIAHAAPMPVGQAIVQNASTAAQRNAPTQYTALIHRLDVLNRKCKACYVKGSGMAGHGWTHCKHVEASYKTEYQKWKESIKFGQQRREPICFKCHLPFGEAAFHRPQTDSEIKPGKERGKVCLFMDQVVPTLWLVWRFPELRADFLSWSAAMLSSEADFAKWIQGDDESGLSRSAKVFMQVDVWLEARRGREGPDAVWTIQHRRPMKASQGT